MQRSNSGGSLSQLPGSANGAPNGAMPVAMPVNAGQQLDLHLVLQRVLELSDILHDNRARTQSLVATASEITARAAAVTQSGSPADDPEHASDPANAKQIAELTQRTQVLQRTVRIYAREQRENARLLGEYETAVGHLTALVRDLGAKKDAQRTAAARTANGTLQTERDAHLATRQERDAWEARFWRAVGMMREAHHRLCDEEGGETSVVRELQGEVRALRQVIGLPAQRPEEETGWRALKDMEDDRGEGGMEEMG
jgi:hypothetical protein